MLLLLALAVPGTLLASSNRLNKLQAVDDRELAEMRGGYSTPAGLDINFGIETAVFIDGILQAVTSFNSLSPAVDLPAARIIGQNSGLIPNSGGALVQSDFLPMDTAALSSNLVTIVQNSLDHRVIDTITKINATVTSLRLYRQNNFMSSLQQQLITSRH